MKISKFEPYNNILEVLKDIYDTYLDVEDISDFIYYLNSSGYIDIEFLYDYLGIISSLQKTNIISHDFLNLTNIGYYNNTKKLVYFDIGFGNGFTNISKLNLDMVKYYFEEESELFTLLGINKLNEIGHGGNGVAYSFDNKVLKITIDESEVHNSHKLTLREIPHINYIHEVGQYTLMGLETKYFIIQDKVTVNTPDVKQRYIQLNNEFIKYKKHEA